MTAGPEFHVRLATPADDEWLFDLHRAAFRERVELVYGPWDDEWQRDAWSRRDPRNAVRIVEVDGERAGAIHTRVDDDGSLVVDLVEVMPSFQSRGVGTALLGDAIEGAERAGLDVTLRVHRGSPAERLYRRLGFVATAETETHVLMRRRATRAQLDLAEYARRSQTNPCFICQVVDGTHHFPHGIIHRDDHAIAFLNRFPTLYGYALVAPVRHVHGPVTDVAESEFLALLRVVHRVGRAITTVVPTERLYVLSLGSEQGNSHIHWHVAPLPPGVPYEEQQYAALMLETKGYLDLSPEEHRALAARIAAAVDAPG